MTRSLGKAKTIWLDKELFPDFQSGFETTCMPHNGFVLRVAEFRKTFTIKKEVDKAYITVFGDCKYRLSVNSEVVGMGPVCAGGDFSNPHSLPKSYYTTFPLNLSEGENEILAEVQTVPEVMTDTSKGKQCFIANIEIFYSDSETESIITDESWLCRGTDKYRTAQRYRCRFENEPWVNAVVCENIWNLHPSPISPLVEENILPVKIIVPDEFRNRVIVKGNSFTVKYGSPVTVDCVFDKIYAGYPAVKFSACQDLVANIDCQEFQGQICHDSKTMVRIEDICDLDFRSIRLQSIGVIRIGLTFTKRSNATIENIHLVSTHYNEPDNGFFVSSDSELNKIFDLCKHTLGICRQSLHLDSPYHQENLACTGDYYIESLMAYFCFGDRELTRFDIVRTIDFLEMNDYFMFHTTYSLILVRMIYDYYMYSGDKTILEYSINTLHGLMERFNSYTEKDGLITNPPNYMFVDHIEHDGYAMHHPPRALGETVLNAFYYDALSNIQKICNILGDEKSKVYFNRAEILKKSFNETFYDKEKELYFDGRNFKDEEIPWRPCEENKRYYTIHSNTLAVLYGLVDSEKKQSHLRKTLTDKTLIQANPYFYHFILDAVYESGLFAEFGIEILRKWTSLTEECDKGLKEVWDGFDCDYSHAWGGTPAYQLPARFSGLEIIEPGMKKIRLSPSSYGLDFAEICIPTPYGKINIRTDKNGKTSVSVPEKITVV